MPPGLKRKNAPKTAKLQQTCANPWSRMGSKSTTGPGVYLKSYFLMNLSSVLFQAAN